MVINLTVSIHIKEHLRIVECLLILPHFFSSEPVLRVQALFLLQNSGILLRQFLDLWQLGYAHFLDVRIGACAVMDCLVNGREAGRMAAQSKAWF